ncbi:MAG: hypothetical protein SAK29_16175 [Scytonema sp. PMC 1069.18]|nr:hypothetical protein [Scytonema sp. PMC 1069.18]MEC4881146.1 hypothetical protein [Scytonema sp. PMC 1070.18]
MFYLLLNLVQTYEIAGNHVEHHGVSLPQLLSFLVCACIFTIEDKSKELEKQKC